ncbi:MAG TPA: hypothetical protein VGR07_22505 [Thermoanaerobaculia bacterium]|jgi:hypothetical protein|nr:hypothetical protein [Thermoanaerobaculia bacterium]
MSRPVVQLPEPGRFWVRYTPRGWPKPAGPWTDLAAGRIGWGHDSAADAGTIEAGPAPLDDLLYLPPVPPERAAERDRLARERLAAGTPVLVQLRPGEIPEIAPAVRVYDLLPALLARDLAPLDLLPAGAAAVWPLLPGLTDDPGLWREGCSALAARRASCVQAMAPRLDPADRRRLVEQGGEGVFETVFHGEPPAERPFAQAAHRQGLAPFLPRPMPRPPVLGIENRRIAGILALAAELWLRLGRPDGPGQALYAMARQADRTAYDLSALAREGNLGFLGWLSGLGREVVEEQAATGGSSLLASLLAEYLAEET